MSNNDIDNDLDVEDFDDASGFDDFNKKGTLGDMWRNNPMVKIGVILAGFAIVLGAIILFGGKDKPPTQSVVTGTSDVTEAPGSSEVSKTMQDSIEEANMQRLEDATRQGSSAIPMPVDPSKNPVTFPSDQASDEDPLERWRRMQEERIRQQEVMQQALPPEQQAPPVDTKTPMVNAMAESMSSQMGAVLQQQPIPKPNYKRITSVTFLEDMEQKKIDKYMKQQQQAMLNQQALGNANGASQFEDILLPAGTIEYGQLLIEANTDAPGPVIAQIVSGPLRGSRVIGSFESTEEYITLNFSTIVIDGINYQAEAVAIDPATTLPGMVTEIDRRYFKRIVLPMAAEFVTGLADAVSESGSTTIFIEGGNVGQSSQDKDSRQEVASGISEAGDAFSDIIQEEADNTQPMLRIAAGTPIGILFVGPVSDVAQN